MNSKSKRAAVLPQPKCGDEKGKAIMVDLIDKSISLTCDGVSVPLKC